MSLRQVTRIIEPLAVLTDNVAKPNAVPVYDVRNHSLVLFDRGDEIVVQAGDEGIRFPPRTSLHS